MDINVYRSLILAHAALRGVDDPYTFYHDETNNIRKLRLRETGLNNPDPRIFVLGGIVHPRGAAPNWNDLFGCLQLQATMTELKLEHLGKGEFLQLARSRKVHILLKWLLDHGIRIHFSAVDVIYWSIVDIIDAVLANRPWDARALLHRDFKNVLYRVLKEDLAATAAFLYSANYPDVGAGATAVFLGHLTDRIQSSGRLTAADKAALVSLLQAGAGDAELAFIQNGARHELIGSFDQFYRHKMGLFKDSQHIFDGEDVVIQSLHEAPFTDGEALYTGYAFVDSRSDRGIQVADAVVGLLGKYWTYINRADLVTVQADKLALRDDARLTVDVLRQAFDAADDASDGFLHRVMCDDDDEKHHFMLWGEGATAAPGSTGA